MEDLSSFHLKDMILKSSDSLDPIAAASVLTSLGLFTVATKIVSIKCIVLNCLKLRPVDIMFLEDQVLIDKM